MKTLLNLSPSSRGALWKIWACLCFAVVNGIVRFITGGAKLDTNITSLPFSQVAFLQNLIGTFIMLPWFLFQKNINFRTKFVTLHSARIVFATCGLVLWYGSLRYMPITYALALSFTSPIITIVASKIFLNEDISKYRLLAIIFSISGAFLITRPDKTFISGIIAEEHLGWTAMLPILSAICWVGSKITSRKIATKGDSPQIMTLYLLTFMVPLSLFPALFVWKTITINHFLICAAIGIVATSAHLSIAKALQLAEITFLTPFGFARLFLSSVIGYYAFDEFPTSISMFLGIILIIASLIILSLKSLNKINNK
jgi:drug/metabolite transporter (DMT)-like permease